MIGRQRCPGVEIGEAVGLDPQQAVAIGQRQGNSRDVLAAPLALDELVETPEGGRERLRIGGGPGRSRGAGGQQGNEAEQDRQRRADDAHLG